jgi:hypothetical protein
MASTIKVDKIEGSTGTTVTVPTGQTFTVTDGLAIGSIPTITVAKGGTNTTSYTAGDVLYASGATTLTKLAKGTAEQVLSMNSGETAPEWTTAAPTAGGTGQTAWAVGDLLYANGVNTLTKLTKPGSTMNLQMTSAGVPSWAAAASGGAWTYLNTTTISGDATVDVETSIDSTYTLYAFILNVVNPVGDGHSFYMRVKSGGSYQTANYQYNSCVTKPSVSTFGNWTANSTSATNIALINEGLGNAAQEKTNGIVYLPNPADTAIYKTCSWFMTSFDGSTIAMAAQGTGCYDGAAAVTGLQFYQTGGNLNTGEIYLYGIKNS